MSVEVQLDGIYSNALELSKKDAFIEDQLEFMEEALLDVEAHGSGKGPISY